MDHIISKDKNQEWLKKTIFNWEAFPFQDEKGRLNKLRGELHLSLQMEAEILLWLVRVLIIWVVVFF